MHLPVRGVGARGKLLRLGGEHGQPQQPARQGSGERTISRARILTLITLTPGVPGSGGVCPKITARQRLEMLRPRRGPGAVGIPGNGST